jgi:hypothetical protein
MQSKYTVSKKDLTFFRRGPSLQHMIYPTIFFPGRFPNTQSNLLITLLDKDAGENKDRLLKSVWALKAESRRSKTSRLLGGFGLWFLVTQIFGHVVVTYCGNMYTP